jgi:hypothetical protein
MPSAPQGAGDRARAVLRDFIEGRWEEARGVSARTWLVTWRQAASPGGWRVRLARPAASRARASHRRASRESTPWWRFP